MPYTLKDNDKILDNIERAYILRVKDLPDLEKPREKLVNGGVKILSAAELLAIILGVGTKKEEVLKMANRILKEYGEKSIVNEVSPEKLCKDLDLPFAKACQVVAAFELGRRFFNKKLGKNYIIRNARQAFEYLKNMGELEKEHLRGLYLNSRYQLIHDELISVGTVSSSIIHPREVFRPALEYGAIAVIVAHNHPSGNIKPTEADLEITCQLAQAGKILGIDLLDHLVIARDKFMSLI